MRPLHSVRAANTKHIYLDVQSVIDAELCRHAARNDIQILKALENTRDGDGISLRNHSKTQERRGIGNAPRTAGH